MKKFIVFCSCFSPSGYFNTEILSFDVISKIYELVDETGVCIVERIGDTEREYEVTAIQGLEKEMFSKIMDFMNDETKDFCVLDIRSFQFIP